MENIFIGSDCIFEISCRGYISVYRVISKFFVINKLRPARSFSDLSIREQ